MAIADDDIVKARNARAMAEAANAANAGAVAAASDPLTAFLDYAKTRPAELNALSADLQSKTSTPIKPINQMTPEELDAYQKARLQSQTTYRETGGGTTPPYPAPEGQYWSFSSGQWKLYNKTTTSSSGGGGATGGGGGGSNTSATDSTAALLAKQAADKAAADAAAEKASRTSAYNILLNEFNKYGLSSLVQDAKDIIMQAPSAAEMSIALQNTKAYQQRFAANQDRIKAGLRALTPAEYIGLEDQYQNIMRNYGLPASYYTKDTMGTQAGFNKFIANDVSAAELEDRIATAQKRVLNADVNVTNALRQFYPDITNADILAYTLDPTNALENIKRKVTAAEIGGAALGQNLMTSAGRAEELAKYGVTKAQAQQGYQQIGEFLPTATQLSDIYNKQGLGAYNQATAEAEIFGTADAAAAAQKRKKLSQLEQASFGGQAGTAQGALARERQGAF